MELYSFVLIKDDATTVDPDEFAIAVDAQSVAEEDEEDSPKESEPSPEPEKKETKPSMKEAQVERVMAAISEAAMQSMRSSGVPHTEIYKRVVALQGAILPILKSPEVYDGAIGCRSPRLLPAEAGVWRCWGGVDHRSDQ